MYSFWSGIQFKSYQVCELSFRTFPLGGDQNATTLRRASICAGKQNRFVEFIDALYSDKDAPSSTWIIKYADASKIDISRFHDCMKDESSLNAIEKDVALASQLNVKGTPSFYINGKDAGGASSYERFISLINK